MVIHELRLDSALATGLVTPVPRAATRTHAIWAPKNVFFWILHFVRFFILDFFRFLASGTRASQPSEPTRGEAYELLTTDDSDELGPTLIFQFCLSSDLI